MEKPKHIVIDARIRRSSTGRPVDRFLTYLPKVDKDNLYTILLDPTDDYVIKQENFRCIPCPYKRFSMNPLPQISFAMFLYKLRADVLFLTQTGLTPLFYFGKNVTFTHDLTMLRYARAGRLPGWLHQVRMIGYRLLFWKGNRFATKIIVPTNFVKDDLAKYMPSTKDKTVVTYESSEPKLAAKSIKPKNITRPFIFHISSPFPHKNVEGLIEAFEILKETRPDLKLVLSGKKEYYFEQLETWLVGRKHSKDIIITGYVSDGALKWLYENTECYVLPSFSEGFGLQSMEAMAHNCPLVSSNATCLPEVCGDAAHYFDPHKPKEMAKAIDEVMSSDKLRSALIKNGQERIKSFSWQKMTKEIHKVLLSI